MTDHAMPGPPPAGEPEIRDALRRLADSFRTLADAIDRTAGPIRAGEASAVDPEDRLRALLDAWWATHGSHWVPAKELVRLGAARGIWGAVPDYGNVRSVQVRLNLLLAAYLDRPIGPYRVFRRPASSKRGWLWALEMVGRPDATPDGSAT